MSELKEADENPLKTHAEKELKLAGLFDSDSDYGGALGEAVMELIDKFSEQGHSGASAEMVISLFNKVARFEPILLIQCTEDEWMETSRDEVYQNKRCSAVFKHGKDGKPHYIDAIVFRDIGSESSFTGNNVFTKDGKKIGSSLCFTPPFRPKTFYVDIEEQEDGKEVIVDESQLDKVFEVYHKPKGWS